MFREGRGEKLSPRHPGSVMVRPMVRSSCTSSMLQILLLFFLQQCGIKTHKTGDEVQRVARRRFQLRPPPGAAQGHSAVRVTELISDCQNSSRPACTSASQTFTVTRLLFFFVIFLDSQTRPGGKNRRKEKKNKLAMKIGDLETSKSCGKMQNRRSFLRKVRNLNFKSFFF